MDSRELVEVVDDHGQCQRIRQRHDQLQRRRKLGHGGSIGDDHRRVRSLHGDAERIVHVYGHAEEPRSQSADGDRFGDRHDIEQLLVDGDAVWIVDHYYERCERQWQRNGSLPCVRQYRIVVSNGDADGGRGARDPNAVSSDDAALARRSPHHQRALTAAGSSLDEPMAANARSNASGTKNTPSYSPKTQ